MSQRHHCSREPGIDGETIPTETTSTQVVRAVQTESSFPARTPIIISLTLVNVCETEAPGHPLRRAGRQFLPAAPLCEGASGDAFHGVWFAAAENMTLIKAELGKDFVMPLKSNRKITLSGQHRRE